MNRIHFRVYSGLGDDTRPCTRPATRDMALRSLEQLVARYEQTHRTRAAWLHGELPSARFCDGHTIQLVEVWA